jgi:magnesium-transporting ATPase (P-type)
MKKKNSKLREKEKITVTPRKNPLRRIVKNHDTTVTPWHSLGTEDIFEKLVTNSKGLDPEEETLISGITIGIIAFAVWVWLKGEGYEENLARNLLLLLMVLFENFHVFNCRSEYRSAFRVPLRNNYFLIIGVVLMQGLHILSMHIPFMHELLGVSPVSFETWCILFIIAGTIIIVMEIFKKVKSGEKGT